MSTVTLGNKHIPGHSLLEFWKATRDAQSNQTTSGLLAG